MSTGVALATALTLLNHSDTTLIRSNCNGLRHHYPKGSPGMAFDCDKEAYIYKNKKDWDNFAFKCRLNTIPVIFDFLVMPQKKFTTISITDGKERVLCDAAYNVAMKDYRKRFPP